MKEITEINESKYIVYKVEDLYKLDKENFKKFLEVDDAYKFIRTNQHKLFTQYLVLKMSDEISINYLMEKLHEKFRKLGIDEYYNTEVKKISVILINSILKLCED